MGVGKRRKKGTDDIDLLSNPLIRGFDIDSPMCDRSMAREPPEEIANVDDFEDAGFPEVNKLQQGTTTSRYLFETKRTENGRLTAEAGNRLGRRGSGRSNRLRIRASAPRLLT